MRHYIVDTARSIHQTMLNEPRLSKAQAHVVLLGACATMQRFVEDLAPGKQLHDAFLQCAYHSQGWRDIKGGIQSLGEFPDAINAFLRQERAILEDAGLPLEVITLYLQPSAEALAQDLSRVDGKQVIEDAGRLQRLICQAAAQVSGNMDQEDLRRKARKTALGVFGAATCTINALTPIAAVTPVGVGIGLTVAKASFQLGGKLVSDAIEFWESNNR